MTWGEWAAWAQAIGGICTFGAACIAVRATYEAPRKAAEFAEQLRKDSQDDEETRRLRLIIFTNLMQFRAQISHPLSVGALNLVDIAFKDEKEVREAWIHFLKATSDDKAHTASTIRERYLTLLEKMARSMGLSGTISVSDIGSYYYPRAIGQMDEAAWLETQDKLNRYKPQTDSSPPTPALTHRHSRV